MPENPRFLSAMMIVENKDTLALSPSELTQIAIAAFRQLPIQFLSGVEGVIHKIAQDRHEQERLQESLK